MAYNKITPIKSGQSTIAITVATLRTVPANSIDYLNTIDIANTTGISISVTVYAGAGAASQSNTLVPGISIPANTIFQWSGSQVLNAGDTIQHIASATGCTITASGGNAV